MACALHSPCFLSLSSGLGIHLKQIGHMLKTVVESPNLVFLCCSCPSSRTVGSPCCFPPGIRLVLFPTALFSLFPLPSGGSVHLRAVTFLVMVGALFRLLLFPCVCFTLPRPSLSGGGVHLRALAPLGAQQCHLAGAAQGRGSQGSGEGDGAAPRRHYCELPHQGRGEGEEAGGQVCGAYGRP